MFAKYEKLYWFRSLKLFCKKNKICRFYNVETKCPKITKYKLKTIFT